MASITRSWRACRTMRLPRRWPSFQLRDLDLLNLPDVSSVGSQVAQNKNPREDWALRVLGDFYATWEIAGVALVDIAAWHYMYEHPGATPAELREAVVHQSRNLEPLLRRPLGARDALLLWRVLAHDPEHAVSAGLPARAPHRVSDRRTPASAAKDDAAWR